MSFDWSHPKFLITLPSSAISCQATALKYGVGPLTALTYVLTIEDPSRFHKSRDVGSFLGLRPRQSQSGKRDPQLGITKAGDGRLRCLLVRERCSAARVRVCRASRRALAPSPRRPVH